MFRAITTCKLQDAIDNEAYVPIMTVPVRMYG